MEGWISIHRCIQNHWLWSEKPFDTRSAWIDMLLFANHKENKFLLGGELVTVERGQFITSELKLMERWGWSKSKVRRFLDLLQKDEMIVKKTDHKKTTITIVNYDVFQNNETTKEPQKDHEKTAEEPQKDTNNNDLIMINNDNKFITSEIPQVSEKIPYKEIIKSFNEICSSLPNVKLLTDKRKSAINARWKDIDCSMDKMLEIFKTIEQNEFLTGKVRGSRGYFIATFDWIMTPSNFAKALEGNYTSFAKTKPNQTQKQLSMAEMQKEALQMARRKEGKR